MKKKILKAWNDLSTLAEHAEAWAKDNGYPIIPVRESKEWNQMYEKWIAFAFVDMHPKKSKK